MVSTHNTPDDPSTTLQPLTTTAPTTTTTTLTTAAGTEAAAAAPTPGTTCQTATPGDGFTETERARALDPLSREWNPEREYEQRRIDQLAPGPGAVTFEGRVVNVSTASGRSARQPKASGWHYLIVKDDSAAILVKLYFAHNQYPLRLGQLVTIWTVFLSSASRGATNNNTTTATTSNTSILGICLSANLFPGRVTSDHIMIHDRATGSSSNICRTPLDYTRGHPLPGLMAVDSYLSSGGHDGVPGVKLLVCVKSIGARKRITRRDGGGDYELLDTLLFDHTAEVRLTLWNGLVESAGNWEPGKTVLLLTDPGFVDSRFGGKGGLGITRASLVEVEPECADAEWLRRYAVGLRKKESLCLEFPEGVWDIEAAKYGAVRMLFTLVEIDKWVRCDARHVFSGFISIVVMEMSLVSLRRRNMLMCAECCGVAVYSNSANTSCGSCTKPVKMRPNPRIFGMLLDETGCITAGKLLWSEPAWVDIFHRTADEIGQMTGDEAELLEQRMMFMRMHLVVGWSESVGRLAVLAMMA